MVIQELNSWSLHGNGGGKIRVGLDGERIVRLGPVLDGVSVQPSPNWTVQSLIIRSRSSIKISKWDFHDNYEILLVSMTTLEYRIERSVARGLSEES